MKDSWSTQKNSEKSFPFATIFKHVVCRHICGRLVSHIIGLGLSQHNSYRVFIDWKVRSTQSGARQGPSPQIILKIQIYLKKQRNNFFFKLKVCKIIVLKNTLLLSSSAQESGNSPNFFFSKKLQPIVTYITSYLVNTVIQRTSEKTDTQEISIQ